ncbi:14043_t:CDS:2, partial [Racocetra persica]
EKSFSYLGPCIVFSLTKCPLLSLTIRFPFDVDNVDDESEADDANDDDADDESDVYDADNESDVSILWLVVSFKTVQTLPLAFIKRKIDMRNHFSERECAPSSATCGGAEPTLTKAQSIRGPGKKPPFFLYNRPTLPSFGEAFLLEYELPAKLLVHYLYLTTFCKIYDGYLL